MLFHDTRLSGTGTLACASCHNPGFGYGDGPAKSVRPGRDEPLAAGRRASSTVPGAICSCGMAAPLRSKSRRSARSRHPAEMNQPLDRLVAHPRPASPGYQPLFAAAFPQRGAHAGHRRRGPRDLRTHHRLRRSRRSTAGSRATSWRFRTAAKRGFVLFNTKAALRGRAMPAGLSPMTASTISACPTTIPGRGRLLPRVDQDAARLQDPRPARGRAARAVHA